MIPQSYPLWIQAASGDDLLLVVGWVESEDDGYHPVYVVSDSHHAGGAFVLNSAFRVMPNAVAENASS